MKSVKPSEILPSRAYFTEFDRVTFSQVAWTASDVQAIHRNVERKLKLLALLKGHVVIAASHLLESELAHDVLLPHPRLFSEKVVVPALRSDFRGFESFLDAKVAEGKEAEKYSGSTSREMAQMLDSETALSVRWQVDQTSEWFKKRLLSDLTEKGSLLNSWLRRANVDVPPDLISQISDSPRLSRQDVYLLAKNTGNKDIWKAVSEYADFLYYLSGARAVRSEGVLPQENLIDFSLSDMTQGRTHLSELEVFFKIFVDLVKAVTHTHVPVDLLDALSVDDILDLHHIAVDDRFVEKYNAIQVKTKEGLTIQDPERLVLLMEELAEFEQSLHTEYQAALDLELPRHLKNAKTSKAGKFLSAIACLCVPVWGVLDGAKEVVVSGLDLAGKKKTVEAAQKRVAGHMKACNQLLDKTPIEAKPILIEFVKHVQKRYANKMAGS